MSKVIICDLDGSLFNIDHRLHHVKNGNRDWDSFFSGIPQDTPHTPVLDVLWAFKWAYWPIDVPKIFFVSGRPEKTRADTQEILLDKCGLDTYGDSPHRLYMRADGDHRQDTVVKSEILDQIISEGFEISFVIDDRPSVVQMWRDRGIFVFHVNGDRWESEAQSSQGLLTLMIGPTGAGKSCFLGQYDPFLGSLGYRLNKHDLGIKKDQIVSSDVLRAELCGDFKDQSKNTQVFAALHAIAQARIQNGLDCVVDATNLHRRDRRAVIEACRATRVRYIVMNRPLAEKLSTAGWRATVPGLIEKHEQRFQSVLGDVLSGDGDKGIEVIDLRKAQ